LEIDKLKSVLRKVKPVGEERYENTAEHSWQIAVFALSVAKTLELSACVSVPFAGPRFMRQMEIRSINFSIGEQISEQMNM
jgi:hypothetical protein